MVHILFSDLVLKHGCSLANVEHVVVSAMSEFCHHKTTPVGFEPTRGDPIGLAGRRLNRSAKVSWAGIVPSLLCLIRVTCMRAGTSLLALTLETIFMRQTAGCLV